MKERRVLVRRRADREFLEIVEKKTGLKPQQLVVRAKRRRQALPLRSCEEEAELSEGRQFCPDRRLA
ncbi:MAG: hypothetical protein P8Y25_14105, partial [Chromatiaceae bacterium]